MKNILCFAMLVFCQIWGVFAALDNLSGSLFNKLAAVAIIICFYEAGKFWGKELVKEWKKEFIDSEGKYTKVEVEK